MARTDDRRAASMFHPAQEIGPVRPLTPEEIFARFSEPAFKRAYEKERDDERRLQQDSSQQQENEAGSEQSTIDYVFSQGEMTEGREAQYSRASAGASRSTGTSHAAGRGGRSRTR